MYVTGTSRRILPTVVTLVRTLRQMVLFEASGEPLRASVSDAVPTAGTASIGTPISALGVRRHPLNDSVPERLIERDVECLDVQRLPGAIHEQPIGYRIVVLLIKRVQVREELRSVMFLRFREMIERRRGFDLGKVDRVSVTGHDHRVRPRSNRGWLPGIRTRRFARYRVRHKRIPRPSRTHEYA